MKIHRYNIDWTHKNQERESLNSTRIHLRKRIEFYPREDLNEMIIKIVGDKSITGVFITNVFYNGMRKRV